MTSQDSNERQGLHPVDPHEHYHGLHVETFDKAATSATDEEFDIGTPTTGRPSHSFNAAHLSQAVQDLSRKFDRLQKEVRGRLNWTEGVPDAETIPTVTFHPDTDTTLARDLKADFPPQEVIPEIRETSWLDFTNRFEDDRRESAIEILVEKPGPRRHEEHVAGFDERPVKKETTLTSASSPSAETMTADLPLPDRIRINSPHILRILGNIDKTVDAGLPNVMLRPFKFLVHYELEIRSAVQRLEESENMTGDKSPTNDISSVREDGTPSPALGSHISGQTVLSHMHCLIEFMDTYVMPTVTRWRTNTSGKIHFKDLWYIFSPGEDVFMPIQERIQRVSLDPTTVQPDKFHGLYQLMWRVTGSGGGRQDLSISHHRDIHRNTHAFKVNCYHIDFDGKYFTPIVHTFSIEPYRGARDITSLQFFPVRFLEHADKLKRQIRAQGKLVFDAIVKSHTHFYYVGPTMKRHPCDCPFAAGNNNMPQEFIESEVIVDYATALQTNPSWAPNLSPWKQPPTQSTEVQDKFRIRYWSDRGRSTLVRTELDHIYDDNTIDKETAMEFKRNEGLFNPFPSSWLGNEKSIREEDTILISSCVPAFVLRTRTFAPLWLWGLESIKPQNEGLRNLKLQNDSFKNTIHALVRTHFLQRNTREQSETESDTVRGKGKGLIFLLHGAPGVGKTFTAESVAAANGRPLFQITCGDLGLTPIEVERALNEIFRFAQMWNCVLLLDECDIFLSQRTKTDLKRNSLVSVFLRVLEFYTGVLFLTTNRVGSLDSAVKSRITWSTYYPPLDLNQTREIWKVNLDLLADRKPNIHFDRKDILAFAKEQFMMTIDDSNNWNGRQIQNAFKVALSLAEWDAYSSDEQRSMDTNIARHKEDRQIDLSSSHFRTIASAVEIFERYLQETTGRSEAQRAFDAEERADTFVNDVPAQNTNASHNGVVSDQFQKKRKTSHSSQIQQKQSGNLSGGQQPRSRNSSRQLDVDDSMLSPQISWANNGARQSSPQGPLTSAAAAMVGKQSQFQNASNTASAKKRKISEGRDYSHDRRGSGGKPFSQPEKFESSSDFEDNQGVGGEVLDQDSDW